MYQIVLYFIYLYILLWDSDFNLDTFYQMMSSFLAWHAPNFLQYFSKYKLGFWDSVSLVGLLP